MPCFPGQGSCDKFFKVQPKKKVLVCQFGSPGWQIAVESLSPSGDRGSNLLPAKVSHNLIFSNAGKLSFLL